MIRALRPEDAPAVAAVQRESEVPEAVPAEGIVHWFGTQPVRARVAGWVAVEDEEVVGWARARLLWKTSAPGVGEVWTFVPPRARGRGHGGRLVDAALAHLREADARVLESWAVVDDGRRFLEARGFRPGRSQRVLSLDLGGVEVPEPTPPAGVRVVPLREVLDRPRELHALDAAAVADVPETFVYDDVRYDEWRRTELGNPALELDGSFVALAGELPVAYAFVYADRAAGVAANDMTGTLPAYRRRGLARLVKLATIRWARAEGFGRFVTESDDENVGMLRLNESLGYLQVGVETEYLREVRGSLGRGQPSKLPRMDSLTEPIEGADHREVGGASVDIVRVGNGRVKRAVYPPGFRWSINMSPSVDTSLCMHAHVGFLARGRIAGEYADGCTFEYAAPQAVAIEPGHDAWVVGDEEAVLIQFDSEEGTARRFGLPPEHAH